MSTAGIDIVQVNIYGVTLADIIEKGVNIPFILGTYGLEKCVAFDVPHMTNTYEQNSQDISTFCSDESFDSVSSDESDPAFTSTHVKQEEEELSVNHSTVAPALPSLFNCSFSTIYSDHVNDINDEEIAPPIEDDNVRERDTNILKNPTNAAETLVDEATIFASHLISESVMDVVLDLLESVENNCSNPPIAQEILDFDEAIHNAEISTLTVENVDEAVPAPYESTQFTAKDAFEETTLPFESGNPNSNQHNLFMPLSSALRAAMNSLDDQLNDNVFGSCLKSNQFVDTHVPTNITTGDNQLLNMSAPRYHLVELDKSETNLNRVEVGNISEHPLDSRPVFDVSQDDFPSSPQNKRICLQNQITPLTNCTRDWITENGVGRVDVVDNVNVFDHDDDDGIDVYENDEVITREQSVPLPTADPLEGVRLTMNNRRKRMTTGSNGELRLLVGKKAVTEETRIIKCAYKECTTQMLLRNGYGRDRLVNHVRTHMKGVTPWKCRICEYASTTEGNIRTHHKLKHSETPWNSALKNESPDDLKALLETFRICFPGWDAKFAIDEHNFPDGSHQFKYLGIDDIIKFQRKGREAGSPSVRLFVQPSTSDSCSLRLTRPLKLSSMEDKTEYAKEQEEKHRRKIILPSVIPWEYGSNKYASQKGSASFGTNRNAVLNIKSTKQLSESNDGVVPQITCLPFHKKVASQSGQSPFGNFREQVTRVTDTEGDEKVVINKIVNDKMTITILKKWDKPNKTAKNSDIGKRRDAVTESVGGRRFTKEEQISSRAAIPKLNDPRLTAAAQEPRAPCFQGYFARQATTNVQGTEDLCQLERNKYMAWIGGQLTLQSQSQTGGFNKPRDVVSMSYYDKLIHDRALDPKVIRKRLEEEKERQKDEGNDNEEDEE